jgi:hypothetical protein
MNRYITHLPKPKEKSSKMPNKATFAQNAHTSIPTQILEEIIEQFQITHSYFSSPITCHTNLKQFSSPHQRDQIFGSMGQAFDYKWPNKYQKEHQQTSILPKYANIQKWNNDKSITNSLTNFGPTQTSQKSKYHMY